MLFPPHSPLQPKLGRKVVYKDEAFFDDLSSERQGYVLGLISSDGYIRKNLGHLKFEVNEKDSPLLDYVQSVLGGSKSFITRLSPRKDRDITSCRLTVCSRKLVTRLAELRLGQAKTFNQPDNFSDMRTVEAKKGYLRGLFDGDGTIVFISKNKRCAYVELCGSEPLLNSVADLVGLERHSFYVLANTHGEKKRKISEFQKDRQHSLIVKNRADVKRFYEYMYEGYAYDFCLERKRSRFLEMDL